MAFSGGTFSRTFDCTTDRDNGVKILASKFDTELDGFATGLSTCILKDGTQTCTAAIPFAEGLTVPDNKTIVLGTNSDITIQYDESTNDSLEIAANVEGAALGIVLKADQGDDNADQHKLNIADGGVLTLQSKISGGFVTYLTHTPNATVADSTTAVAGNLTVGGDLTLGSGAVISEAELEAIDGVTAGTVTASKAVIVDSNKDIASFRNVTLTGELDAGSLDISGDADIDGTLEADAMTLNGTAITATATLDTGISNNNVPKFTSGVADDDFLRVAGTAIEGRSASEVLSDIAALPLAGGSMTGAVTITTADNTTQLTLTSTDADASEGPRLDLHRNSASPADNDSIGAIRGLAENDASENIIYTEIQSKIIDVTDGTEDGEINLQVRRNGTLRDAFIVGSGSVIANEGGEDIDFRIEGDNETHAFFLQGSSGFIGVNESSPQNQLHITTSDFKALQLEGPRPTAFFKETDGNANENYQIRLNGGSLQFQSQNDAQSSAVDRMIIDSSGRVGIGTSSPSGILHTAGSGDQTVTLQAGGESKLEMKIDGNTDGCSIRFSDSDASSQGQIRYQHSSDALLFNTSGSQRMSLDSGALGVGVDAASASGRIHVSEPNNRHAGFIHNTNASMSNPTLQVSTSRNTTNQSYNHFRCSIHGVANKMAVMDSGDVLNSNNSYGQLSDQRMKENIVDAASQWDDIKALQVRKFNFIGSGLTQIGVVAQELETAGMDGLISEAEWFDVDANPDNEVRKSVKYSVLYMKAIKALQEAMTRIETLETKVAALESGS